MKKGETYNGTVERVDYPNKGIVCLDGVTDETGGRVRVLVKRVLPGERISLRLKKKRRGRWEGAKIRTIEYGPGSCAPVCPHAADCGGCAYQRLSYEAQLDLKESQVRHVLARALGETEETAGSAAEHSDDAADPVLTGIWEGIHASPSSTDYRNKMEFTFGDEYRDGPLALGLHKQGAFHDIVTADGCRLCDPDFSEIVRVTLDFFAEKGIPFYHRMHHTGYLRHLLVRKGYHTGEILIDLVTAGPDALDTRKETKQFTDSCETVPFPAEDKGPESGLLQEWARQLSLSQNEGRLSGRITGILHTRNDRLGDVIEDQGTEVLAGQDHFTDRVLDLDFKITPFSFFQTNTAGAEVLYQIVRDYLGDVTGRRIYDLYSGTGTIAQILAPAAEAVTGVEIVQEAVEAARENAERNGLPNCRFLCGDVFEVLDQQTEAGEKPDVIVLDPPREGVRPQALKRILSYGAERIVYVSCQVTSLARDLPVMLEAGYRLARACSVDMFPCTTGVETVILLSREKSTDMLT